jgi:hypothetical protein
MASEPASALAMSPQSTKAEIADRYGKLPLSFERNEGQTDREVKFLSRGRDGLFLTATGRADFTKTAPAGRQIQTARIDR